MQKITPCLWFDNNAEEAADFYLSVFKDAKKGRTLRSENDGAQTNNNVITVEFELFGQKFVALNGGPVFNFTEAVSFMVNCKSQDEVDYYWNKLSEGGEESMCGWLKDKFGVSWQVVPDVLPQMLTHKDPAKANAAMQAMLKMKKIDIAKMEAAMKGVEA